MVHPNCRAMDDVEGVHDVSLLVSVRNCVRVHPCLCKYVGARACCARCALLLAWVHVAIGYVPRAEGSTRPTGRFRTTSV
eukprot:4737741-Prymnesium_polylepis.1